MKSLSRTWRTAILSVLCWSLLTQAHTVRRKRRRGLAGEECETTCQEPPLKDLQHFEDQNLIDPAKMLDRLKASRQEWVDHRLKEDYGTDTYLNIFEPMVGTERANVGRNLIFKDVTLLPQAKDATDAEHPAWDRFIRKLQIKVLQIQLGILEERERAKEICLEECGIRQEEGSRLLLEESNGLYSKFTWATGGHSAAAGHGNFFRESYTANMERALLPILKSIGLDFEARNYAMGGTDSGEEVALCMNQIFGRDIDAISWDFGMTDGHDLWKMAMYAYKAAGISQLPDGHSMPGSIPRRPLLVAIHQNTINDAIIKTMQDLGMTTLVHDMDYLRGVIWKALPDMFGMTDAEIEAQPTLVQYFKCDGKIEVGDPGCKKYKFNNTLCSPRKARTSWHPGWKDHALIGNLLAMTILDGLEDALQGLIDANGQIEIPTEESLSETKARILKQLQGLNEQEQSNYDNILASPIPPELQRYIKIWWNAQRDQHMTDMDIEAFFKEPSFCHSAVLPSEARFQGLVTEDFAKTGTIMEQNYDTGIGVSQIRSTETPGRLSGKEPMAMVNPKGDGKLMLVQDESARQVCSEHLNLDYKDFFYVSSLEGWQTITLPNDSEKTVYTEFDATKSKGYILVCLVRCDWGKCPAGDLHSYFGWMRSKPRKGEMPPSAEELAKIGQVEILINGEAVTEAADMRTCYALKNQRGHVWTPNTNGQYEIKMRVTGSSAYAYLRVSSFVLV